MERITYYSLKCIFIPYNETAQMSRKLAPPEEQIAGIKPMLKYSRFNFALCMGAWNDIIKLTKRKEK